MARNKTIPQKELVEEIVSYTETANGSMEVTTGVGEWIEARKITPHPNDPSKDYIAPRFFKLDEGYKTETTQIEGGDFDAMMSIDPPWCPGKGANSFERDDLWHAVDAKRNGTKLAHGRKANAETASAASNAN